MAVAQMSLGCKWPGYPCVHSPHRAPLACTPLTSLSTTLTMRVPPLFEGPVTLATTHDNIIARAPTALQPHTMIDADNGLIERRIFSDPEIYREELRQIFARTWHFMCHESQVAEPGQFFLNQIGEDRVIVVRDRDERIQVLLNTCPHRGNTVCRADEGQTRSFFCSYHGWNFDLNGNLLGVPGFDDYYRGGLDRAEWGLARAAQVDSYKGFVFATLDATAPPLYDFLGWVARMGLDTMAGANGVDIVPGIQKNRLQCNWKLAVDNLFDWYHPKVSHGSAIRADMLTEASLAPHQQMVMLGEFGHAIGGPYLQEDEQTAMEQRFAEADDAPWRATADARNTLGPTGTRSRGHPSIFPNVWIASGGTQLCLRLPRGPLATEIWWFTFVPKGCSDQQRRKIIQHATHFFGPAGLLEQDDGENWSHSTRGSLGTISQQRPLHFAMGLNQDQPITDATGQTSFETVVNELGQRWTYQAWADWMQAPDWRALQRDRTEPPVADPAAQR